MGPKMRVVTVLTQTEYVHTNGIRKIVPITISPIDKKTFKSRDSKCVVLRWQDQTNYRVTFNTVNLDHPYHWTPKPENKLKLECKLESDVKPWIKCETKDVKLLLKSEFKVETKVESNKDKQLSSDQLTSDELPIFEKSLKRSSSCDDLFMNKRCSSDVDSVCSSNFSLSDFDDEFLTDTRMPSPPHTPQDLSPSDEQLEDVIMIDTSMEFDPYVPNDLTSSAPQDSDFSDYSMVSDDSDEETIVGTISRSSSKSTEIYDISEWERRQSMDRFDRKLRTKVFETILSEMSVIEKLKTECLCKEWQQLMVCQQKTLLIEYRRNYKLMKGEIVGQNAVFVNNKRSFNVVTDKLINKFPQLTEIQILCSSPETKLNAIVDKVNEKLPRLEMVKFQGLISPDVLIRFAKSYGHQLKSIDINSGDYQLSDEDIIDSNLLSMNLKTVYCNQRLNSLTLNYLPQLREVLDVDMHDMDGLRVMADTYCQQITKVLFSPPPYPEYYLSKKKDIGNSLELLSRFESLEYMDFYFSNYNLVNEFHPIEDKCKNLKELHIIGCNSYFPLDLLKGFKKLEVLGLFFDCKRDSRLTFHSLMDLDLTELWMCCDIRVDELLEILGRLKRLTTLHIKSNHCWSDQIIEILDSDNSLQTIFLEDVLITETTLKAIINRAKKNPDIHYNMFSEGYEPNERALTCCRPFRRKEFPPNLTVILRKDTRSPYTIKKGKGKPRSWYSYVPVPSIPSLQPNKSSAQAVDDRPTKRVIKAKSRYSPPLETHPRVRKLRSTGHKDDALFKVPLVPPIKKGKKQTSDPMTAIAPQSASSAKRARISFGTSNTAAKPLAVPKPPIILRVPSVPKFRLMSTSVSKSVPNVKTTSTRLSTPRPALTPNSMTAVKSHSILRARLISNSNRTTAPNIPLILIPDTPSVASSTTTTTTPISVRIRRPVPNQTSMASPGQTTEPFSYSESHSLVKGPYGPYLVRKVRQTSIFESHKLVQGPYGPYYVPKTWSERISQALC